MREIVSPLSGIRSPFGQIATASFGGNYLATESSDRLDAENGDNLILES